MGGLLHLVQRGGDWAGPQPTQAPPCCTKCNSPPINGQCTKLRIIRCSTRCRCQEDPVSLPSGRLKKTTGSSPHHVAQHHPTGSETSPPYAPRSSRFGSEAPTVEDDVDVWHYAILELHARNDDDNYNCLWSLKS